MKTCQIWDPRQLPVLLNTAQAAQLLGVCQAQVRKLCAAGKIPASRVGDSHWRIKKDELLKQLGMEAAG